MGLLPFKFTGRITKPQTNDGEEIGPKSIPVKDDPQVNEERIDVYPIKSKEIAWPKSGGLDDARSPMKFTK